MSTALRIWPLWPPVDRIVGAQLDRLRILVGITLRGRRHVLGNIHHHRTRTTALGDIKRLLDRRRNILRTADTEVVLHDWTGDTEHVGFLEGILPDQMAHHLAGDHHHRNGIHESGGDPRHRIGCARTRCNQRDTGLAGCARVGVRHVSGGLLVAHENMLDIFLLKQGVIHMPEVRRPDSHRCT